jgi:uncharacterized C2H2 Zn-finger protein
MSITKKTVDEGSVSDTPATPVGAIADAKIDKLKNDSKYKNCKRCNRAFKKAETLAKHVETCQGKLQGTDGNGGAREGAGRPAGSESAKTKELKAQKAAMQALIASKTNQLLTAQFRMAMGTGRLYVRHVEQVERGRGKNKFMDERIDVRPVLDDDEFMIYLSLSHDEYGRATDPATDDEYYYMPAKEGNYLALSNLLDRAYGKPKENVELGEDPDAPLPVHGTGTTTALRTALIAMVKQQIKEGA